MIVLSTKNQSAGALMACAPDSKFRCDSVACLDYPDPKNVANNMAFSANSKYNKEIHSNFTDTLKRYMLTKKLNRNLRFMYA